MLEAAWTTSPARGRLGSGSPLLGLAELRRRQGRGGGRPLARRGRSGAWRAALPRPPCARPRRLAQAVELARSRVAPGSAEQELDRFWALELLVRARVARGELEEAGTALEALREVEQLVGTPPMRAFGELAEGVIAAAAGEHARARPLLEDAVDRFERCGAPFESARARIELATSLIALGRTDDAQREAAAALETPRRPGRSARGQTGPTAARDRRRATGRSP